MIIFVIQTNLLMEKAVLETGVSQYKGWVKSVYFAVFYLQASHIDHPGSVLCLQICAYPYFGQSPGKKQMTLPVG